MRIGSTAILVTALCATSAAAADVAPVDAARTAAAGDFALHAAYGGLMPARTIHHIAIVYGNRASAEAGAAHPDAHPAPAEPPSPVRQSCS